MGKLVRDLIPEIIRDSGREPVVRVLDQPEYLTELLRKLVEEAEEAATSPREKLLEEIADVHEVLLALLAALNETLPSLESLASEKRSSRGAFRDRLYLESW
ncbi:MAG TPA: nucleoside triphosphate pyrophosphohydrolase [Acidimicrobiales bacterium]